MLLKHETYFIYKLHIFACGTQEVKERYCFQNFDCGVSIEITVVSQTTVNVVTHCYKIK